MNKIELQILITHCLNAGWEIASSQEEVGRATTEIASRANITAEPADSDRMFAADPERFQEQIEFFCAVMTHSFWSVRQI